MNSFLASCWVCWAPARHCSAVALSSATACAISHIGHANSLFCNSCCFASLSAVSTWSASRVASSTVAAWHTVSACCAARATAVSACSISTGMTSLTLSSRGCSTNDSINAFTPTTACLARWTCWSTALNKSAAWLACCFASFTSCRTCSKFAWATSRLDISSISLIRFVACCRVSLALLFKSTS